MSLDQPAAVLPVSDSDKQSLESNASSSTVSDIDIVEPLPVYTNKALFYSSQACYHDPSMNIQSIESQYIASAMLSFQSDYATTMVSETFEASQKTTKNKSRRTDHLFKSRYRDLDKLKPSSSSSAKIIPTVATIPRDMLPTRESSRELSTFMYKLCHYSNLFDAHGLSKLISSIVNDNAYIRVRTKMLNVNTTGSMVIVSMNMHMAESFPDGMLRVLAVKNYRNSQGVRKIKAKLNYAATKVFDDLIPEGRPALPENHDGKYMIADTIDDQVSNSVKDDVRRCEVDYKRQQKSHLLKVEYEVKVFLTIDSFSNKIAIYEAESKLISFAGKPLREIVATK
jgi:hypothetical protein